MAAPNVTVWHHATTTFNDDGLATVEVSGQATGTHAISGGGFATGLTSSNGSSTNQNGEEPSLGVRLVGSFPYYDSGSDTTTWNMVFGGTPGGGVRAHVFAILAQEA